MKLNVIGSTKPGYVLPVEEALKFSGLEAGICYMPDSFEALQHEPEKRTLARVKGTVGSGHHSVSGHAVYNFEIEGVPKILAMLLNNEKEYTTSEKSGRYTVMATEGKEKETYDKWVGIFTDLIAETYPSIDEKTRRKLALENARYFISVFTPATTMGYSIGLRQANYIIGFCEEMSMRVTSDPFMKKLKPWLAEFAALVRGYCNVDGLRDNKGRKFSLFTERTRKEYFGDTYSVNYLGTFAQLAQAQRHRSLWYEMQIPDLDDCAFYVPPIIGDNHMDLRGEYLHDMHSLKENYPQGMLVHINERGTSEAFMMKCCERLCGAAQLEICTQTAATLKRYISNAVLNDYPDVFLELSKYQHKTKCQLGFQSCNRPCPLGPAHVFDRLI